jgi:hypothetical protein
MLNRYSALTLVLGLTAGYAIAGPATQAQDNALPFAVGDTITLHFEEQGQTPATGSSTRCAVAEIRGIYVKCTPSRAPREPVETWISLKSVAQITRHEP